MSLTAIQKYLHELEKLKHFSGTHNETSVRSAFYLLLAEYADENDLVLVTEASLPGPKGTRITPDGTLKDVFRQDWGYWESKDEADDLDTEIAKKLAIGYPDFNILFEDSTKAVLIQEGQEIYRVALSDIENLDKLLRTFVTFERPEVAEFRQALELFARDVPSVTANLKQLIYEQEQSNPAFVQARKGFLELCQAAINPAIDLDDVKEMMVQHILTADIFITIFDEPYFHRENNIAKELEKVLDTFFTGTIRKNALHAIQHYYLTIKATAARIYDHHEKQKFLKGLYEAFYRSYNPQAADRLGVVYTPSEIVKYMIESTDNLLFRHFGTLLEDKGVDIIDPATGTGTFICDIIDYLPKSKLEYKYNHEIHGNEIAILPYYIANLNIEFTYKQKTGKYLPFEKLCFVDTLDNLGFDYENKQTEIFGISQENVKRIKEQNERKISVVLGNPPYNAKQENYNFQNANWAYEKIKTRIKNTFVKNGSAQNQIGVYDMYTCFYRWALDRIGEEGIVCFVTNNSFINGLAFNGFRKTLEKELSFIYIIDLGGNIRELSGRDGIFLNEKNTIFGKSAAVGIAIMWLVKIKGHTERTRIRYLHPLDIRATRQEKLSYLKRNPVIKIEFDNIRPDKNGNWINLPDNDFDSLIPIISKAAKTGKGNDTIFTLFGSGLKSQRDAWVYDFDPKNLVKKMTFFTESYNQTVENPDNPNKWIIKWDRELDKYRARQIKATFSEKAIVKCYYRPFTKKWLYYDKYFNGMTYQWPKMVVDGSNRFIAFTAPGAIRPFHLLASRNIIDLHLTGDSQVIPFVKSGTVSNITPWALSKFQNRYPTDSISEADIFNYVYAVLHNPAYRKKYELNLKRDFPRIPFYQNFKKWANWGKELLDLHIDFESQQPFPLQRTDIEITKSPKPKLKADRETGTIFIDDITTLTGIPEIAWEYRLGFRSALEWVLDQYKPIEISDKIIAEQFDNYNFTEWKETLIELMGKVCTVSVKTLEIMELMEKEEG